MTRNYLYRIDVYIDNQWRPEKKLMSRDGAIKMVKDAKNYTGFGTHFKEMRAVDMVTNEVIAFFNT